MAVNFDSETLSIEVERLKTSIKYHDWFLGFVVVIGISLTIYLVDSMDDLKTGLHGVRLEHQTIRQEIQEIHQQLQEMHLRMESLDQKMDRYHRGGDNPRP